MVTDMDGFRKCAEKTLKLTRSPAVVVDKWTSGLDPRKFEKKAEQFSNRENSQDVKLVPSDERDAEIDNYFRYSLSKTEEVNNQRN